MDGKDVKYIRSGRLEWLEHVIRMLNNRMPKGVLDGHVLEDVEKDLKVKN